MASLLIGCKSDSLVGGTGMATMAPPRQSYGVAMAVPAARPHPRPPQALQATLTSLTAQFGGRVGIAVQSVGEGWTAHSHGDLYMPQQSVSKLWVALTMLDAADRGQLRLSDPITVTRNDLTVFHQPIAVLAVKGDGYHTTIGDLDYRALTTSDNTANDRILNAAGGGRATEAMFARKGIVGIRVGPDEKYKQAATAGLAWRPEYSMGMAFEDARARLSPAVREAAFSAYAANPSDGAQPDAIVDTLARLVRGELLSPASTQWMLATMGDCKTGWARLKYPLPDDWQIAHKTGTGQDWGRRTAGFNDVGILTAPDGRIYTVAVMIGDGTQSVRDRQKLIQDVARAIVVSHDERPMAIAQQDARAMAGHGAN
ncbi:serine hydrolase [Sphingomonas koreensis]|nr:serine hydrolase [Sphingomonas koreensis]